MKEDTQLEEFFFTHCWKGGHGKGSAAIYSNLHYECISTSKKVMQGDKHFIFKLLVE